MFQRTLNGADMINATSLNLPPNENAVRINGDFGTAGQVLAKDSNNKLNWSRVDDIEIPDGSIGGEKLKSDISITTTGDITATNITATNILKTNTTLDLPFTTTAINITGGGGNGSAGQVLVKDGDNKLAWDFVDDIEIPDRSITHDKLVLKTITDAEIADNAIITRTILDANVTEAKLATDSVTTDKIVDANFTAVKLATNSVITDKIKDANVTADKLATDSVTTDKVVDGAITTAKVGDLQITTGKLANGAVSALKLATDSVTTDKIEDGAITGGKLASNIAISTTGTITADDITGATITAQDHFVQTASNGPITNTFTGGLSISGGAFTQTSTADNTLAGALFLTKAGNASAPTSFASGGFALQVGDASTNSDVYIKRNLIVDGLIRGAIVGDVSDTHINTQSLVVHNLSAAGTSGIQVEDDYDIRLLQSYGDIKRIELKSSTGTIHLFDSSGAETIVINGQDGDIELKSGGSTKIKLDASVGVVEATSVAGEASGFHIIGRGGIFDGYTVTADGYTSKSFIENVDFGAFNNWNLPGRTFRKVWMPVKNASGLQVRWTYTAVSSLEADNNWHDASGESATLVGRGLLDIENRRMRTSKIKATITMNMACNYQLGFRLVYRTASTLPAGGLTGAWTPTQEYLCLGDDWTDTDSPEYLGRKTWTWTYPLFPVTQGHYYSFRPEFFIKYAPYPYATNHARVQFWVGSALGYAIPTEKTNSDMPAIFEITEMPEEQTEFSDTAGTYPASAETLLSAGYHMGDLPPSSSSDDDY